MMPKSIGYKIFTIFFTVRDKMTKTGTADLMKYILELVACDIIMNTSIGLGQKGNLSNSVPCS